jgi:hypothetical protein
MAAVLMLQIVKVVNGILECMEGDAELKGNGCWV